MPAHSTTGVIWKRYKTNVREWRTQRLQRQTLSRNSTAKSRRGPVALKTLPPTALVTLQQRQARRHVGPSNVCGPASSPAGPQTHNSEYLSCHQRYRFRLMHAPRSILAYNPLHLNEIVRERWTVSHPTEPRRGHTIDRALLVMSPPISDSGND